MHVWAVRAMCLWAALNFLGGLAAALLAAAAVALSGVCENRSCDNAWLVPLIAAPVVTLGTLGVWWLTGRRHPAWLAIGTAALAVPLAVLMSE